MSHRIILIYSSRWATVYSLQTIIYQFIISIWYIYKIYAYSLLFSRLLFALKKMPSNVQCSSNLELLSTKGILTTCKYNIVSVVYSV